MNMSVDLMLVGLAKLKRGTDSDADCSAKRARTEFKTRALSKTADHVYPEFRLKAHVGYFLRCLRGLPESAEGHDSNRITIAYFCLSALDLLGVLRDKTTQEQRTAWADWVWSLQAPGGGFCGSTYMKTTNPATSPGHLPSTYTALLVLAILGASFDRLDVAGLRRFVASCQAVDGSCVLQPLYDHRFSPVPLDAGDTGLFQNDARMSYCAAVVCDVIGNVPIDLPKAVGFLTYETWEGAYASRPGVPEAQGGTTYCCVAALSLFGKSHAPLGKADSADTLRWLTQRQVGGFQGRPGKLEDVCYSFWCGGALTLLHPPPAWDGAANARFLLEAQHGIGGFGKEPDDFPDPYHSYLALAALRMTDIGERLGLAPLDVRWNVATDTAARLKGEIARVTGDAT